MNPLLKVFMKPILRAKAGKNLLNEPAVVNRKEVKCIGHTIDTTLILGKPNTDIPPFWHDVYDNNRLGFIRKDGYANMYCIFDFDDTMTKLSYSVAIDSHSFTSESNGSKKEIREIHLPEGRYVRVEFLKKSQKAASMVAAYVRTIWVESQGYSLSSLPSYIVYGEPFHRNYSQHGCDGDLYCGRPYAEMYIPIV